MIERYGYLLLIVLISASYLVLAALVWFRSRHERAAMQFLLLLLSLFEWTLSYGIYLMAGEGSPGKTVFADLQYIGATIAPVHYLLFVVQYQEGGGRRFPVLRWLLFAEPLAINAFVWTDSLHHLIRRSVSTVWRGSFNVWATSFGPVFWAHIAYSSVLTAAATVLLLRVAVDPRRNRRPQAFLFIAAAVAPWAGNIMDLVGIYPTPIDSIHFGFFITAICLFVGSVRYRLFLVGEKHVAERILQTMSDFVLLLDPTGRILRANPALTSRLGRPIGDLVGTPWDRLLFGQAPAGLIGGKDPREAEVWFSDANHAVFPVSLSVIPFPGELVDRIQGYLLVGRDVSVRLRLEEERSRALRLETIRRLAAGIAHDFNNILAAVSLNSEGLARGLDPRSPLASFTDRIRDAVKRATEQADKLLMFSGQFPVQLEPSDLNEVMGRVEAELRAAGAAAGLRFEPSAEGLKVALDAPLFEKALRILIEEAGRLSGPDARLTVGTGRQAPDTAVVSIRGFTRDRDDRADAVLFDPYVQSARTIDTNLELAVAYGIVTQHGGLIRLETGEGGEAELRVILPLSGAETRPPRI